MLKQLYIRNFTLIDELDITFQSGFSVITGETGAGKSIILGAIGLLLGQRADLKSIKQGAERCVIEAHFDLSRYQLAPFFKENDIDYDAEDCIIRRELTATGKSRAFINDTPMPLNTMRQLGEQLVDIHSQHQNLLLNKEDFQLNVVDIIANNTQQRTDYQQAFQAYHTAQKRLEQLKADIQRSKENEDFLRFQYKEITDARLEDGIQERLEQESETLSHAEEIKSALYSTDRALNGDECGVVEGIKSAVQSLQSIEKVYPDVTELVQRLDTAYIELKDVAQEISANVERIDFDPSLLDDINNTLDRIYTLEKKYHVETVTELMDMAKKIEEQLNHIDNSDEELDELSQKTSQLRSECEAKAKALTETRIKAARKVEKEMSQRLVTLGIPHVRFEVQIEPKTLTVEGGDKISFLFSANKNTSLQPVSQVASGGEIARVMLSLKAMISGTVKLPTIIFDEIDTGVSGKIAEKMAEIMHEMGEHDRQVISITHLPQIAAWGTTHYKVSKEELPTGTVTHMRLLTPTERIHEIAQLLSGSDITEAAINNAKALLK